MTITLADRYAATKAAFDAAEKALDALKAEIKAAGAETHVGVTCDVTLSLYERTTFNGTMAKQFLTDAEIKLCEKVGLCEKITVKAKGLVAA